MGNNKKYYIIYETRNLKNGKIYIGMHETDNLEDGYLGSGTRLKRAIRYYGKEFFEKRILHIFDNKEDMISKEIEIVNEDFISREDTYNLMPGGKGGYNVNLTNIEAYKKNGLNASKKNFLHGIDFKEYLIKNNKWELYKDKISNTKKSFYANGGKNGFSGKNHSEETKKKLSEKAKQKTGTKNSQYGTCWIYNSELKENKKIAKSELEYWLNKEWIKGRKIK